jgi:hypothetical protein
MFVPRAKPRRGEICGAFPVKIWVERRRAAILHCFAGTVTRGVRLVNRREATRPAEPPKKPDCGGDATMAAGSESRFSEASSHRVMAALVAAIHAMT